MMIMNYFCGVVDRRKALSLIFQPYFSPSQISDTPRAEFESTFMLCGMKWCSSDKHYIATPLRQIYVLSPGDISRSSISPIFSRIVDLKNFLQENTF